MKTSVMRASIIVLGTVLLIGLGFLTYRSIIRQVGSAEIPDEQITMDGNETVESPAPQEGDPQLEGQTQLPLLPSAQADPPPLLQAPRYEIVLVIDFEGSTYQGNMQVEYTNAEDVDLEQLYFRLLPNGKGSFGDGTLDVENIMVGGSSTTASRSSNDTVMEVNLPHPLPPGETVSVGMDFNGVVPVDFSGGEEPGGYGIFNLSQDVMALAGWYPILAVYDEDGWNLDYPSMLGDSIYSDMAYYSVDVETPDHLQVLATGVATDERSTTARTITHFESGPARDFFIIASPHFQSVSREVQGTTVNAYYLPSHQQGGKDALSIASDSLRVFNQVFGPYPYTELDIVEAPMRGPLGVEYPGLVIVSSSLYDTPEKPEFVTTVAHEVAHQWWYNVVGNDVFDEPWLDEALTTYSSALYYEFGPAGVVPQGLIDYWQGRYDGLRQDGEDDLITNDLAYFESLANPRVYGGVVYSKGALFFHALRDEIGSDAFFEALQHYYKAYQYQIATGEALLEAFELAAGHQLDEFYRQWLFTIQTP